jgi:hypothetical protein
VRGECSFTGLLCNKRAVEGAWKEDMKLKGTDAVLEASFWLGLGINVVAQHKAVCPVAFKGRWWRASEMRFGSCTPITCKQWWYVASSIFKTH